MRVATALCANSAHCGVITDALMTLIVKFALYVMAVRVVAEDVHATTRVQPGVN